MSINVTGGDNIPERDDPPPYSPDTSPPVYTFDLPDEGVWIQHVTNRHFPRSIITSETYRRPETVRTILSVRLGRDRSSRDLEQGDIEETASVPVNNLLRTGNHGSTAATATAGAVRQPQAEIPIDPPPCYYWTLPPAAAAAAAPVPTQTAAPTQIASHTTPRRRAEDSNTDSRGCYGMFALLLVVLGCIGAVWLLVAYIKYLRGN